MYNEDNDYDTEDDNEYNELSVDIICELNYDKKIEIINFYKEKLLKEPEFIGIKNICSGKILNFIENKNNKLIKKDYKVNSEQYLIFLNMYSELNYECNYNIINSLVSKIFNYIYV